MNELNEAFAELSDELSAIIPPTDYNAMIAYRQMKAFEQISKAIAEQIPLMIAQMKAMATRIRSS